MSAVLIRLLTLKAENVIPELVWVLVAIYVCALLVSITSVVVTYKSAKARLLWTLFLVVCPFLGIVVHCLHSLTLADVSSLKQFGFFSRKLT